MKRAANHTLVAGLFAAGLLPMSARAQSEAPVALVPVVVTATRLPESELTVGTDVDQISGADLGRRQLATLADALSEVPAAPAFSTGQTGAATSLFLRGANSDQTLFLVDGVRMNDANTDYANFLGGARLFPTDTVEVAKGPQSTLYGSDASGGVVSLETAKGTGKPSESLAAEAGSFGTVDGTATAQGAGGAWAYNFGLSAERTRNTRPNNRFDGGNVAGRLDYQVARYLAAGATLRGFVSRYGDPGDEFTNSPYNHDRESNWLGTVFLDATLTENVSSKLTLGGQDRDFDYYERSSGQPSAKTVTRNRRAVADWQNVLQVTAKNRLVTGATAEDDATRSNGFGDVDNRLRLFAVYAEDEWTLPGNLTLTGGARRDHCDTFGAVTTGRLTAAWLPFGRMFKLRGSYGTGFDAPSFLDLYGRSSYYVGNPGLRPERSRGWDGGFDVYSDTSGTLGVTWFQTDFTDLISYDFSVYPGTTGNVGRARTRGWEIAYRTSLAGLIRTKFGYTRLTADDLTDATPLLRRPHYTANADFWVPLGRGLSAGVDGNWVGTRADVDARTFATVRDSGYAVARVYAEWQVTPRLALKARVENALDRHYEAVNGYPQPGSAAFGGAVLTF